MTSLVVRRLKTVTAVQAFIIIVVIFATVFVVKFYGRTPTERIIKVQVVGQDWTQSFDSFEGFRPPFWLADKIEVGDIEVSPDGGKIAEVIKVEKYERVTPDFEILLTVRLRGEESTRTGRFKYREETIEVGKQINLHFNGIELVSQVIDDNVPKEGYPRKEVLVTARIRNAEPWIISKLKLGDTITDAPGGAVIAEIASVKIEPASNTFFQNTINDVTFVERSTRTRDLILTLIVKAEEHGGLLYFAGFQNLKVGNSINLFFPEVNLFRVEIQNVHEIKP